MPKNTGHDAPAHFFPFDSRLQDLAADALAAADVWESVPASSCLILLDGPLDYALATLGRLPDGRAVMLPTVAGLGQSFQVLDAQGQQAQTVKLEDLVNLVAVVGVRYP